MSKRAAFFGHKVPGWIRGAITLTALLIIAALTAPAATPFQSPSLPSASALVPSATPTSTPTQPALLSNTLAPVPSATPIPTPTSTATPTPSKTPTPTPSATFTLAPSLTPSPRPTRTPRSSVTPTATAERATPTLPPYVPPAYAGTTLGQAVTRYNAIHLRQITLHVVGAGSDGVDGEMYRDLLKRGWRIMGPEDFAGSIEKPGWPYLVIARADTLDANAVAGWGYVLDHEFVHMVAAANLWGEGLNLAELMRRADGTFAPEARFHEVCADFYPRDSQGRHRPVAQSYGAMEKMPALLRVLETYDLATMAHDVPPGYQVLHITGLPVVDAACVWDRQAMEVVRALYDQRQGAGAFDALFPSY